MALHKSNRVNILGNPSQNTATLEEVVKVGGGGSSGGGVTEEFVAEAVAPKADKTYVDTELIKKADKSSVPTKGEMQTAIKVVEDETNAINERVGTNTTAITGLSATQATQATAIAKLQTDKADKTALAGKADASALDAKADKSSLNKAGVGLDKVDNTADSAKPVSTAQKTALDKKVNLDGIHKTYNETAPIPFIVDNVDVNTIDYGESYIQTNTAVNAPPDTSATLIQKIKTHSAGQDDFPFVDQNITWEQGTTNAGGVAGQTREQLIENPNNLAPSRVRSTTLIPVEELSKIRLTNIDGDFRIYMAFFGPEQLTMGAEINWTNGTSIAPPKARYAQIVIRKTDSSNITPEEVAGKFKISIAKTDVIKGEGSLEIAWGATKGDLHTRVVIKNGSQVAYGAWNEIGSRVPNPTNLPDGATLVVKNGKWTVVLPPEEPLRGV